VPCRLLISFQPLSSLSSLSANQSSSQSVASVPPTTLIIDHSPIITTIHVVAASDTGNDNSNNKVALVGGVVGAVLGATVLGLIGLLLWRRKRGGAPAPLPTSQQPLFGQQPSSQPITPASMTFSANISGPSVTRAAQSRVHPQQPLRLVLPPTNPPTAGQPGTASQQSASSGPAVRPWIEIPSTTHQETYGNPASPSRLSPSSAEAPENPREFYNDAIRAPTNFTAAPTNVPSSSSGVWNPPSHAPPYFPPRTQGHGRFGG